MAFLFLTLFESGSTIIVQIRSQKKVGSFSIMHKLISAGRICAMIVSRVGCLLAALTVVVASLSFANRIVAATADEQEIRSLIARYNAAANARDLPAVMTCYAAIDSLLVYDVSHAPYKGVAAVTKDWGDFMAAMREIKLEFREIEVEVGTGEYAFAHFIERASMVTKEENQAFVNDDLRATHVFKKINGQWLIVHEHKSKSRSG